MQFSVYRVMGLHFVAAILAVFWFATGLQAATVFGNGSLASTASGGGFTFNAHNAWAVPFTTAGTTGGQLELASARILVGDHGTQVLTTIAIFADSGTNGGPTGSALAVGSALIPASGVAWNSINFGSAVTLASNTNYYFVVQEATGSTGFRWANPTVNSTYSDMGSGSSYAITPVVSDPQNIWGRVGTTWSDSASSVSGTPFGFQLVAVPEPSSLLLICLGGGLLLRRRR